MNDKVEFDRPKLVALKRAYERAKIEGKDVFVFEGKDYLLDYTKYLIEYLEGKLSA